MAGSSKQAEEVTTKDTNSGNTQVFQTEQPHTENVTSTEEEQVKERASDEVEDGSSHDDSWSTPVKVSRTPEKTKGLESGQGPIISDSRFAVLSSEEKEEEGEILQQEETVIGKDVIDIQVPIQKKPEVQNRTGSTRPSLPAYFKRQSQARFQLNFPKDYRLRSRSFGENVD